MSKGVGKVLGIVASIAIPFAAPAIAGAIGLSSAVTSAASAFGLGAKVAGAVGGALSGGLVGAAGGALTSIATGQNPWEAAAMGAIGGGISGGIGGWSNAANPTAGITRGAAGSTAGPAARTTSTVPAVNTAAGPASRTAATVGAETATSLAPGAASAGNNATFVAKSQSLFGNLNPNIVRDVLIQGAARVMAGNGYSAEYKAAARRALQLEQEQDRNYFALKSEIESIDPAGRGAEWHAQAKLEGLAATEAAVENINPNRAGLRTETERRGLHQTALNQTLAYRQGFDSGRDERRAGLTALAGMPRSNAARDNNEARRQADIDNANRTAGIASSLGSIFAPRLPEAASTDAIMGRDAIDSTLQPNREYDFTPYSTPLWSNG